jgi:hypothetical protein
MYFQNYFSTTKISFEEDKEEEKENRRLNIPQREVKEDLGVKM